MTVVLTKTEAQQIASLLGNLWMYLDENINSKCLIPVSIDTTKFVREVCGELPTEDDGLYIVSQSDIIKYLRKKLLQNG